MLNHVENIHPENIFLIRFTNCLDQREAISTLNHLVDIVKLKSKSKIIIDVSLCQEGISVLQQYKYLNYIVKRVKNYTKLAVLSNDSNEINREFIKDITFKTNIEVGFFKEIDDAKAWF